MRKTNYLTVKQFAWLVLHHRLMDTINTLLRRRGLEQRSSGLAKTYLVVFRVAPDL